MLPITSFSISPKFGERTPENIGTEIENAFAVYASKGGTKLYNLDTGNVETEITHNLFERFFNSIEGSDEPFIRVISRSGLGAKLTGADFRLAESFLNDQNYVRLLTLINRYSDIWDKKVRDILE